MKTRPSGALEITVLALASIAVLPVVVTCFLGLATLLLPALAVLVPLLVVTPLWWLLGSSRGKGAPVRLAAGAGAGGASLAPALRRSIR
jgi:hypothetical protein